MNWKRINKTVLTLTLTLTPLFTLTLSAHAATQTSQLNTIDKNIASIKTELQQATIKKSQLQNALAKTETDESHIHQQLKKTQHHLSKQQKKLQQLEQQTIPLADENNLNRTLLKQQIRAAYLFNQAPYLKLLLAPNDVMQTQRMLMYFHYITKAQMKTMTQLQQSLTACKQNQKAIQKQYATLLLLKQKQLDNQQAFKKSQVQRKELIEAINQHIQTKHQKLWSLMHDKQRLEKTIEQLNAQTKKIVFTHLPHVPNLPFGRLQGKLTWPAEGHIRDAFGTQIYQSELKWDGTLIAAPLGEPIHSVAAGRVIFSKWMAGYGLLLIINQGNGYMTLYGRAETLTKTVGDYVSANEVIGTVGKSGGFAHSALYFSIRHDGTPVNPGMWCR